MGRIPHDIDLHTPPYPVDYPPPDDLDTKELSPLEVYLAHKAAAAADDYDERMRARNSRVAEQFSAYEHDQATIEQLEREMSERMEGAPIDFDAFRREQLLRELGLDPRDVDALDREQIEYDNGQGKLIDREQAVAVYDAAHEEYMRRELAAGMPGDFADERTQYRAVGIGSLFRTIARVAHAVEEWAEGQAS